MILLKKLLAIILLLLCTKSFAQSFFNEISISTGQMSPQVGDTYYPNSFSSFRFGHNISKRLQVGLALDYCPNLPYSFHHPSIFQYKDMAFQLGWGPEPSTQVVSEQYMIDVLNPKIFAGVNARWKWFHFYAGASAGYAHYIGKPIGGFLETVRLGANYAYENRANEFIDAYRKAMRPRSGYSLGFTKASLFLSPDTLV